MVSPARRNAAASYVNFIVLAAVGLVVNPILLGALGPAAFGVWRATQRFLDFATVADGGATQALKWIVAFRSGKEATPGERRRDVGAAVVICLIALPVLVVLTAGITVALPWLIRNLDPGLRLETYWVGAILAANVALFGLLSIPDSVLAGTNQGYRSTIVTTGVLIASNIAMAVEMWLGLGIVALALTVLLGGIVNALLTWYVARSHVSWWGVERPQRTDVAKVAKFSGWVLAWSFIQKLLLSSELILISVLVGAVAVSQYTFTTYAATFALAICLMTTSAFAPRLGSMLGSGDLPAAQRMVSEIRQLNLWLATVAGAGILLLNGSFVSVWVGRENYLGDGVNAALVAAFVQLAVLRYQAQLLDTTLDIRLKVAYAALGTVLGLALAFGAYNLTGSLVAMLVAMVAGRLVTTVAFPVLVSRQIPGSGGDAGRYVISAAILVGCGFVGSRLRLVDWPMFVSVATATTVGLSVALCFVLLSGPTRAKLLRNPFLRSRT